MSTTFVRNVYVQITTPETIWKKGAQKISLGRAEQILEDVQRTYGNISLLVLRD